MNEEGWDLFLKLCQECKNTKQMDELFALFLTLDEKNQLSTRALLIKALLINQKSQRQIAEDLSLSIAKITRGSNALKTVSDQLKIYLKKIFISIN